MLSVVYCHRKYELMINMEKYKNLIQQIQKHKIIDPPDDLVAEVMSGIDKLGTGLLYRIYRFLLRPCQFTLDPVSALRKEPSIEEKSLYFMLVAFAHLTIAVVLLMGLKSMETRTLLPPLLWWQPWVSLFLAGWLVFWALILKKNTRAGIKAVRVAALFYIEAVVINGALLFIEFHRILFLVPFIAAMIGSAVAAGIFLALISSNDNVRILRGASVII
jgi:hypothetical protein